MPILILRKVKIKKERAMNKFEKEIQILKQKMKGVRNDEIRTRANFLLRVMLSGNVTLESERLGKYRQYFYHWYKRWQDSGYEIDALKNISTAAHQHPNETPSWIIDKAEKYKTDYGHGGHKTAQLLLREEDIHIAGSTLCSHFAKRELTKVRKPKSNKHKKRYASENPLDRVQIDTTGLPIEDNYGNTIKLYAAIDCCSRLTSLYIAHEISNYYATKAIKAFFKKYGLAKVVQTDNGVEYTNKYLSLLNPIRVKEAVLSGFEKFLKKLRVRHYLIRPRTPQLNGKVERFNQTIKRELSSRLQSGMTFEQIKQLVDDYEVYYNTRRPHDSLNGLTPYEKFNNIEPQIAA